MPELTRTETDSLGPKLIPKEAYYGISTMRALENFDVSTYKLHPELIRALVIVKWAALQASNSPESKQNPTDSDKLLSDKLYGSLRASLSGEALDEERLKSEAQTLLNNIFEACEGIIGIDRSPNDSSIPYEEHFAVDPIQGGAGTSLNMNVNEVIANIALEKSGYAKGTTNIINANDHINMSQSTNDVVPTAARVCVRVLLNKLITSMEFLHSTFLEKSIEFADQVKIGRTHLQDAVPIRLGDEFHAYASVLQRDIDRIKNTGNHLYKVNLGATAVGTGLNALPNYTTTVIPKLNEMVNRAYPNIEFGGFKSCDSLVDGTQNTDCFTEVSAALKICMTNMSKIANDIRLMASGPICGFGEISLKPLQHGSSIMPGKVNPVMPELINQVAFQIIGNDLTISLASEAGQFELNVMQPVLIYNLIQSVSMMERAFKLFGERCVKHITVTDENKERMEKYANKSPSLATALNPKIGYSNATKIVKGYLAASKIEDITFLEFCLRDVSLVEKFGGEKNLREALHPANAQNSSDKRFGR